jgi:hypothetical protein
MVLLIDTGGQTAAVLEDRHAPFSEVRVAASERSRTLDDVLSGAWEGLVAATHSTVCPVCEGELAPRWSAGAGVVGGRCRDCGSELS